MSNSLLFALAKASTMPPTGADISIPWARIVIVFLFCIALAVGAILWLRARHGLPTHGGLLREWLKRSTADAAPKLLDIEQRLRVSPTGQILVLRCDGRRYLVHVSAQQAQLLDRLEDAAPHVEPAP